LPSSGFFSSFFLLGVVFFLFLLLVIEDPAPGHATDHRAGGMARLGPIGPPGSQAVRNHFVRAFGVRLVLTMLPVIGRVPRYDQHQGRHQERQQQHDRGGHCETERGGPPHGPSNSAQRHHDREEQDQQHQPQQHRHRLAAERISCTGRPG
jgi:hypothetical protein